MFTELMASGIGGELEIETFDFGLGTVLNIPLTNGLVTGVYGNSVGPTTYAAFAVTVENGQLNVIFNVVDHVPSITYNNGILTITRRSGATSYSLGTVYAAYN